MLLSELVRIKNSLIEVKEKIIQELDNNSVIRDSKNIIDSMSALSFSHRDDIFRFFSTLKSEKEILSQNLYLQILELEKQIDEKSEHLLKRGFSINGAVTCAPMSCQEERLSRISPVDPDLKILVKSIISLKTSPQFATLEIGPGDGDWTEYLVAADPLYIIDIHQEFLDSTRNRFPESYRPRMRPYLWQETEIKNHYLEKLPQEQFGFVFAYDVFDFFPADFFENYLIGIFNILRPGGSAFFTYNDCNNVSNARLAEVGFKSWMPRHLLEKIAKKLNFEIESFNCFKNTYWCILRKPGSLRTVKTTQSLGKIVQF
jgi:SAM-dependent methyltransferase